MPVSRIVTVLSLPLTLAACGSAGDGAGGLAGDSTADSTSSGGAGVTVVASLYPLEYAVEQVGGEHVEIVGLTASGADPHDVELNPQDVATVGAADLVVYSSGLQSAVDEAVSSQAGGHAFDVNESADLVVTGSDGSDEHTEEHTDEHAEEHEEHATDEHHDEHEHETGGVDPHFWLDPTRYASVTTAIAEQLAELDPDHAADYEANAADFAAELDALDQEFATGLADCDQDVVVVTHEAFGYLTDRHGFTQFGITGLSPEAEPSPAAMAEIARVVEDHNVGTVYSEVILGSELADTIARETGAQVRLLDPVEGITERSPGDDYVEIMRANLASLRAGQNCR